MKIKLFGAAREVTGSCSVIETNGRRFAIDCGMHQGGVESDKKNNQVDIYDPRGIDFFIITHAHIDHSGLLPRLVKNGFRGPVYTTAPTRELLNIMLLDSAHVQEMESQWRSMKRQRHGEGPVTPLYTLKDAQDTFPLIKDLSYDRPFSPFPGVSFILRDAGHILGAALVELTIEEDGKPMTLLFSGDIGRPAQLLVRDPSKVNCADFLFLEATYGERNHKNEDESLAELAEAVDYSYRRGEKVIIPAFAVERTQEMIYSLYLLDKAGRMPKDMPVYVDSPMAIKATEVFQRYHEYFDEQTATILKNGENPLKFKQLHFTETREESVAINNRKGPA
ncbi:MAG: MBL fold metallo-hydrolase, partial [Smithellaceae bacterium]|nr:MBL fold metallo-hydrolase [Smithellaceae bacterium]